VVASRLWRLQSWEMAVVASRRGRPAAPLQVEAAHGLDPRFAKVSQAKTGSLLSSPKGWLLPRLPSVEGGASPPLADEKPLVPLPAPLRQLALALEPVLMVPQVGASQAEAKETPGEPSAEGLQGAPLRARPWPRDPSAESLEGQP